MRWRRSRGWSGCRFGKSKGGRRFGAAADDAAPLVGAPGVYVFVLGEFDCLDKSLAEVADGGGGLAADFASGRKGDDLAESGSQVTGGNVVGNEPGSDVVSDFLSGVGFGFLLRVEVTEVRVVLATRCAAATAIGKSEGAHRGAHVGAASRHKISSA